MKLTSIQQPVTRALKIGKIFFFTVMALIFFHQEITAQATLSLQGILKKSNGVALEDGTYNITFKIYPKGSAPGATPLWTEVNPNVELNGGIYSVILGEITDLDLQFNEDYELGVQLGSQEMSPRIQLTSAPYALALRGSTNQFPSSGLVLADKIKVAQGVIANTGAPIVNDVDGSKGYSFLNDNDSGLFSTSNGEASIYTNGVEKVEVTGTGITLYGNTTVQGTSGANQFNVYNNGGINYSSTQGSFPGWRLVDADEFNNDTQGWSSYGPVAGQYFGWNQSAANGGLNRPNYGVFAGWAITPTVNNQVLKKQFNIAGSFSQIKVKFRYYVLDSWDNGTGDLPFAGFATDVSGSNFKVAWTDYSPYYLNANGRINTNELRPVLNFTSYPNHTDHWVDAEMSATANGSSFWVYFGAALDSDGSISDESFAIGYVEIWVR